MEDARIILSASWIALALTYLLGDVLRIYSGDFKPGQLGGFQLTQKVLLGIAALFVIPIIMVFLCLTLPNPWIRWANIGIAIIFFIVNAIGVPSYPSAYDRFLIVVSLGFNILTVWYAFQWG